MFQPIFGRRAIAGVGVHMRGGNEARVLGESLISLYEDTLSGFKARSTGSLTAVGRDA